MLPAPDADGHLPPGRHRGTLDEIEALYVDGAPFESERRALFEALRVYVARVRTLFPRARIWVDGGFVTHKSWAAPDDIDVMVLVKESDLVSVDDDTLDALRTHVGAGGSRVQAMGGLVDGFFAERGKADVLDYWNVQWSRVKGEDGTEVPGPGKGYVEVFADE